MFDTDLASKNTDDLTEGSTNLYYTDARVTANASVAANTTARHDQDSDQYLDFGGASQVSATEAKSGYDHISRTDNPHSVTKDQVGLANVTNEAAIPLAQKGANDGVATLDGGGKVPTSQLPALAVTSTYTAADETAQLALTVQEGDVVVRTDENKTYIALNENNSAMSDWQEMLTPTDTVLSVNGETGAVSLNATSIGLDNVDNTSDADKPISTATQTALDAKLDDNQLIDEDDMASDSDTHVPTQQSVKAYVNNKTVFKTTTTTTASLTLTATHYVVLASGASTTVAITLPTAVGITGREYIIKCTDFTNNVTVETNGAQTIDGDSNFAFSAQYESLKIISDGANWFILSVSGFGN